MLSSAQLATPGFRPRLPTELIIMIIRLLPHESLIQAARVCYGFQLEAEAHIYHYIAIGPETPGGLDESRFLELKNSLLAAPRRCALVKGVALEFGRFDVPMDFYTGALSFLLSNLPNIKSLTIPIFPIPGTPECDILFHTKSRIEEFGVHALEEWPRLGEFYASQPSIRKLVIRDNYSVTLTFPKEVLPALNELVCDGPTIVGLAPGRPITKVISPQSQVLPLSHAERFAFFR